MDKKLKYLIDILKEAELYKEANELTSLLVKSANVIENEIVKWQSVIEELEKRPNVQIQTKALLYLIEGAKNLAAAEPLKSATPEEIANASKIFKSSMKRNESPEDFLKKNAGVMSMMGKVTPFFSFVIALKNIYYGFQEFKKIQSESEKIGMSWMDTLLPSKTMKKAKELQEDPESLKLVTKITKSAMLLWDEGISLIVNLIDGFKDMFFLFADLGTLGWSAPLDFSLSMLLWLAVEVPAEAAMKSFYEPQLRFTKTKAQMMIASLIEQNIPSIDDSESIEIPKMEEFNKEDYSEYLIN